MPPFPQIQQKAANTWPNSSRLLHSQFVLEWFRSNHIRPNYSKAQHRHAWDTMCIIILLAISKKPKFRRTRHFDVKYRKQESKNTKSRIEIFHKKKKNQETKILFFLTFYNAASLSTKSGTILCVIRTAYGCVCLGTLSAKQSSNMYHMQV